MITTELTIYFNESSTIAESFYDVLFGKRKLLQNPIKKKPRRINPMSSQHQFLKDGFYPTKVRNKLGTVMIVSFSGEFSEQDLKAVKETMAILQGLGYESTTIEKIETTVTTVEKHTITF